MKCISVCTGQSRLGDLFSLVAIYIKGGVRKMYRLEVCWGAPAYMLRDPLPDGTKALGVERNLAPEPSGDSAPGPIWPACIPAAVAPAGPRIGTADSG